VIYKHKSERAVLYSYSVNNQFSLGFERGIEA